jgi:hypothetical protein
MRYEGVSKSFRTGRLERELQMVQLCATRCSCIAIMSVDLVSFAAITLCVASQRVFIVVVYFVIDSVRKLLDIPSYLSTTKKTLVYIFTLTVSDINWNTLQVGTCATHVQTFSIAGSLDKKRAFVVFFISLHCEESGLISVEVWSVLLLLNVSMQRKRKKSIQNVGRKPWGKETWETKVQMRG